MADLYLLGGEFYQDKKDAEKFFIKDSNICFLYEHNAVNNNSNVNGGTNIYDVNSIKNCEEADISFNNYLGLFPNVSCIDNNADTSKYNFVSINYLAVEIDGTAKIKVYLKLSNKEIEINNKKLVLTADTQNTYELSDADTNTGVKKGDITKFLSWAEKVTKACKACRKMNLFLLENKDKFGKFADDIDVYDCPFLGSMFSNKNNKTGDNNSSGTKFVSLGLFGGERTEFTEDDKKEQNNNSKKEQKVHQYRNYIDELFDDENVAVSDIINDIANNPEKFINAEINLYCKIHNCSKNEFTNEMKNFIFAWKLYNPGRDYLKYSLDELKNKKDKHLKSYMKRLKEDKQVKFIF